jgi:hypothetical protein
MNDEHRPGVGIDPPRRVEQDVQAARVDEGDSRQVEQSGDARGVSVGKPAAEAVRRFHVDLAGGADEARLLERLQC